MNHIFIIGTRAQLIKVAPVIYTFENNEIKPIIIFTGQHKDTMEDLLYEFSIKTKPFNLIIAKEHASIFALLTWAPSILIKLIQYLKEIKNASNIYVHGDTLTTLISAIAGKITKNKIIHLESGLTSNNLFDPFPEEIIRRIVFKLTDIACCPSKQDAQNMQKYKNIKILNTHGNTILDSILQLNLIKKINKTPNSCVISIHRFQNINNVKRLNEIVKMLVELSKTQTINMVLHPATLKKLKAFNLYDVLTNTSNINLLPRMTYQKFITLSLSSDFVISDGGSNQEELAFFGHPTIILRETTERSDGIGKNAILINDTNVVLKFINTKQFLDLSHPNQNLATSPSQIIYDYVTKLEN